jgi:rare lipoprotein A
MQLGLKKTVIFLSLTTVVSGCGLGSNGRDAGGLARVSGSMPSDSGAPTGGGMVAEVDDQSGQAQNVITHDEVGYAGWYGDEMRGQPTASGEPFDPNGISAAHPTLPMPSYAEVTNLDTGKTVLVRINDRGPQAKGQAIALSAGAARLVGIGEAGRAPVRVRRVNPPDQDKAALRLGQKGSDRIDTPPQLLTILRKKLGGASTQLAVSAVRQTALPPSTPSTESNVPVDDGGFVVEQAGARYPTRQTPRATPVVVRPRVAVGSQRPGATYDAPSAGSSSRNGPFVMEDAGRRSVAAPMASRPMNGFYVQVAAFGSETRARATAGQVGGNVQQAGTIWRVRKGPFETEAAALAALGPIASKGYRDARITR